MTCVADGGFGLFLNVLKRDTVSQVNNFPERTFFWGADNFLGWLKKDCGNDGWMECKVFFSIGPSE